MSCRHMIMFVVEHRAQRILQSRVKVLLEALMHSAVPVGVFRGLPGLH